MVKHHADPERYPCPCALTMNRRLGDYHLIVAGGIADQPAGAWLAQQYAGWIFYLCEQQAEATDAYPLDKRLKASDLKVLWEQIRPIQMRLAQDHG